MSFYKTTETLRSKGEPFGWGNNLSINDSVEHPVIIIRPKTGVSLLNISIKSLYCFPTSNDTAIFRLLLNPTTTGTAPAFNDLDSSSKVEVAYPPVGTDVDTQGRILGVFGGYRVNGNSSLNFFSDLDIGGSFPSGSEIALSIARIGGGTDTWYFGINTEEDN